MSDFLTNLIVRSAPAPAQLAPRLPSRFESPEPAEAAIEVLDELSTPRAPERATPRDARGPSPDAPAHGRRAAAPPLAPPNHTANIVPATSSPLSAASPQRAMTAPSPDADELPPAPPRSRRAAPPPPPPELPVVPRVAATAVVSALTPPPAPPPPDAGEPCLALVPRVETPPRTSLGEVAGQQSAARPTPAIAPPDMTGPPGRVQTGAAMPPLPSPASVAPPRELAPPTLAPYTPPRPAEAQARPDPPSGPPTIHVTIGRVEVRAALPAAPARREPRPTAVVPLDEYLRSRRGGV